MTDQPTPAEQIPRLLEELHDRVETRDVVPRYRRVNRGRRDALLLELAVQRTTGPGLLAQLGVVASAGHHPGVVIPGAAVPGGSAGWDADGALSPMARGGKPESAEPITEAWHVGREILDELDDLKAELAAAGHTGSLVDVALADADLGWVIAARLRNLVSRARVAAGYDAPIVTLRDVCCPDCAGPLRVRADASTAVWCGGHLPLHGPPPPDAPDAVPIGWVPCSNRWPRHAWIDLLDQTTERAAS